MTDEATHDAMLETRAEAMGIGGEAAYWNSQLELADKDHRDFLKEGRQIVARYKGDEQLKSGIAVRNNKRFNILYSNTRVLKAALFARMAKPDIRRRFADPDPVGRQVAEIIERSVIYCDDSYDAEGAFAAAVLDYLLPGRGVVKICYEANIDTDDSGGEEITGQKVYEEHVCWDDFRHDPAKQWGKVTWIAFRHLMNRDALKRNGFKDYQKVPLNWSPTPDKQKVPDSYKRAEVWEIWDKQTKTRIWTVKGYDTALRKDPDPYGLEQFFPIAEPLCAIATNDTVIPRPEFSIYRDQADGLDEIEQRIDRLTRALKRRGVYDATISELKQLAKAPDNHFIPVKNYADLMQKGGLQAAFQTEDIKMIAGVLNELHQQRDLRIATIYEVIGIADIMRGVTNPNETLGAQRLKSMFGGNRLKDRQNAVQKWIRDTLRLKAEIIAEHFEPEKLAEMTGFRWTPMAATPPLPMGMPAIGPGGQLPAPVGQPSGLPAMMNAAAMPPMPPGLTQAAPAPGGMAPPMLGMPLAQPPASAGAGPPSLDELITPEMIDILRNDKLRGYRVDIETDSTVFEDAESEKQSRTELIQAMSQFVANWTPLIQVQPKLAPLAFDMLSFGVRGFKAGRQLEDSIDRTAQEVEEMAKQPQQPQQDPKAAADAAKAIAAQEKARADIATTQAKSQAEIQSLQAKMTELQGKLEFAMAQLGLKKEELRLKAIDALGSQETAGNA